MNFPKPKLSRDAEMRLWISEHSDYAKEQVVLSNIGLVGLVMKRMGLSLLDEDLYEVGVIGLCEAINRFDASKGVQFSTYATLLIRGSILQSFRKKRIATSISLDEPYRMDSGDEVSYGEMIADKKHFEEEVETTAIINQLAEKERKILHLYAIAGVSQGEIAKIIGVSQAQVSRILRKIQKKLEKEFDY